jgi:hypothetical protein
MHFVLIDLDLDIAFFLISQRTFVILFRFILFLLLLQ